MSLRRWRFNVGPWYVARMCGAHLLTDLQRSWRKPVHRFDGGVVLDVIGVGIFRR